MQNQSDSGLFRFRISSDLGNSDSIYSDSDSFRFRPFLVQIIQIQPISDSGSSCLGSLYSDSL